jgi:hypothetical protein
MLELKSQNISRPVLCESAGTVVMKTIRLQFSDLDPWIFGSDIKVVHLVRDPRAIVHSMQEL